MLFLFENRMRVILLRTVLLILILKTLSTKYVIISKLQAGLRRELSIYIRKKNNVNNGYVLIWGHAIPLVFVIKGKQPWACRATSSSKSLGSSSSAGCWSHSDTGIDHMEEPSWALPIPGQEVTRWHKVKCKWQSSWQQTAESARSAPLHPCTLENVPCLQSKVSNSLKSTKAA